MGYKFDRCLKQSLFAILIMFYFVFQSFIQPWLEAYLYTGDDGDCRNVWKEGSQFDLKLMVSTSPMPTRPSQFKILANVTNISYSQPFSFTGYQLIDINYTMKLSEKVKQNRTQLYFFLMGSKSECQFVEYENVSNDEYCYNIRKAQPIIQWIQKKVDLKHNLITEKAVEIPEGPMPYEPVVFTNMSFDIVFDREIENPKLLYAHNAKFFLFSKARHFYLPPVSYDNFWDLDTHRTYLDFEHNETVDINVKVYLRRKWLWNKKLEYDYGQDEHDYMHKQWEDMKRAMVDTPPFLLWTTIFVTIAHVFLNLMAFREDISWWNSRDSMTGISMQSVVIGAFSKFVIFLYLIDEDTSTVVRVMHGLGVLLEFWKISKLVEPILPFPWFKIKDSYKSSTMEADWQGSKYTGYAVIPCLIGYAIYSLIFNKFKSVYSFFLRVAVGAVYAFGFMAMIPQIYINYKLKTVAGMSGPVLAYKFVNTFIDDLFAFVMTMPTLHRIACFRDDIVFFVWLYQRHIYPTDNTRVNEFGETFDEDGNVKIVVGEDPEKLEEARAQEIAAKPDEDATVRRKGKEDDNAEEKEKEEPKEEKEKTE